MPRPVRALVAALGLVLVASCGTDDRPEAASTATEASATPAPRPTGTQDPGDDEPDGPDGSAAADQPTTEPTGPDDGATSDADETEPETAAPALAPTAGQQRAAITVDGRARAYEVVVPEVALDGPVPLVLAFHGFGQQAASFVRSTGLADAARTAGWVLVAPDGVQRSFNAGGEERGCCGPALEQDVDDVALARALVAEVGGVLGHVPSVVVATGFSNGGMLSHRLGCEAADLVDGVVAASGALFVQDCAPVRAIEVRHVHGSSDLVVPQSRGVEAAETWARLFGCAEGEPDDATDGVEGTTWGGCDDDVRVAFLLRRRSGHDWLRGEPLATNDVIAEVVARVAARAGAGGG